MAPILQVKELTHVYSEGTPFEHTALRNISFSVERGEFVGIIGHTGSGKSTLIQHLNGLLKPTSGQVLLDGRDIWESKAVTRQSRFRVGLVFQYPEYQLFEETVFKDIAFGPRNMGLQDEEIRRRVEEAADFVGLTKKQLDASPFDLSGGQKRRVAIAGVIAMEPEVLILDEPTAGLDPAGREEILGNILAYRRGKNATIMMVSHSMGDVARLANRLLVMNGSNLAMDGAPQEVFAHSQELLEMGLDIPVVTRIFLHLRRLGLDVPQVYTMEQAADALEEVRRNRQC
ncbi:MAG TPA: energy-coupling factor transporter ATPase [Candidatus Faecousia intestinigallinarum]|nr:energy-coupling factor transporter ATPase [Candidatus Faecousia intestinigallinarum]